MRPTSGTGSNGFTLIEVLVVVAITGLIVALAVVNLMPSDREVALRETARIALAIENARDTAWFGGRPIALTFSSGRLRRLLRNGNAWSPDPTHELAIGPEVRVAAITVNDQALGPEDGLVFMPDGLDEPFRVALEVRGLAWAVDGDAAGSVKVVER
jgi:type II secretion system protein H